MRDQLTDLSDAGAGRLFARPRDFAQWGAERGILAAKSCLDMPRPWRRRAEKIQRSRAKQTARKFLGDGASQDEADLYFKSYERAFQAQIRDPGAVIEIKVVC